jgi:short-subunit dehydrogenase
MHAFVTGASAGIGAAIATRLATTGYDVTLVARRDEHLRRVAEALPPGARARCVVADVSDLERLPVLLEEAEAEFGPIDVLVNNAGIQIVALTPEVTIAEGERLLTINVLAPFRLTQSILPRMLARRSGTIVDVASLASFAPTPGLFHYSASKAAVSAASEALRAEIAEGGVHVVTVYPGIVSSDMEVAARARFPRDPTRGLPTGSTRVLAELVVDAIERKRPRVIYPRIYVLARWFPSLTRWVMDHFSPRPLPRE